MHPSLIRVESDDAKREQPVGGSVVVGVGVVGVVEVVAEVVVVGVIAVVVAADVSGRAVVAVRVGLAVAVASATPDHFAISTLLSKTLMACIFLVSGELAYALYSRIDGNIPCQLPCCIRFFRNRSLKIHLMFTQGETVLKSTKFSPLVETYSASRMPTLRRFLPTFSRSIGSYSSRPRRRLSIDFRIFFLQLRFPHTK
jgi:hypothetical protein